MRLDQLSQNRMQNARRYTANRSSVRNTGRLSKVLQKDCIRSRVLRKQDIKLLDKIINRRRYVYK